MSLTDTLISTAIITTLLLASKQLQANQLSQLKSTTIKYENEQRLNFLNCNELENKLKMKIFSCHKDTDKKYGEVFFE